MLLGTVLVFAAVVFQSFFSSSCNDGSKLFSHLMTFSPGSTSSGFLSLVFVVIIVILIVFGLVIFFRKRLKIFSIIGLIAVVTVAVVGGVWYSEASINYWLVSPYTSATKDNVLTMYCENSGRLAGTFDLVLSFTNAHFSLKTSLPYNFVDDQTVKFTFTLQPGETQNRTAWFVIDDNVSDFYVDLSFAQNDGNIFVRSASGGVDSVSYQKDVADSNFTLRTFAPPP